jgi:hypothetical protein
MQELLEKRAAKNLAGALKFYGKIDRGDDFRALWRWGNALASGILGRAGGPALPRGFILTFPSR